MSTKIIRRLGAVLVCAGMIGFNVPTVIAQDSSEGQNVVVETASQIKDGAVTTGQSAIDQGRKLWSEAFMPAVERTMAALPALLKGIALLIAFWLAGSLVGAGVRKLLNMTQIDERAIRDWGLEGMLKRADGSSRSLSDLLGATVKWILVLFGFVAFFNAINLTQVAGPLQSVLDSIVGIIPNLLKATVILLVYWAIATVVRMGLTRILVACKLDERAGKHIADADDKETTKDEPKPSAMLGRLAFYVVLLFGLPPFLEALGQDALVSPLQEMLSKALAFLPNFVAAGIIVLVGRIVASIVREFISNLLVATGLDSKVEKIGIGKALGNHKVSSIVAQLAYFFILIPIIIAAVDSLGIKVIADPIKATLQSVLSAVPAVFVATIVVLIGCVVAKVVRSLVSSLLAGVGLDGLPERLGLAFLAPKQGQMPLSDVLGAIVQVIILLITAQQAAAALKFEQLADLVQRLVVYLPNLAIGLVIILATISLGKYVGDLVSKALKGQGHARLLSIIARSAIFLLGIGMALEQLGIGQDIVAIAVAAILGGSALAIGLAFGLGGKDKAKETIDRFNTAD